MAFQATLNLNVTEGSVNIANNTSIVTVDVTVQLSNSSSASSQTSSTCSITCAGQTKTITVGSYSIGTNGSKKLGSVSFTIAHNADGSKNVSCGASWTLPYTNGYTAKGSASKTLQTIPRASSFTVQSNITLGDAIKVNITRASNSFTHKLYYNHLSGGGNWVLFASNVGTSYSYTPSLSFANSHPNEASFTLYVGVDTYSGSTKIGTSNKPVKVTMSASMAPTITEMYIARVDNGVPPEWATYVRGFSKAKVTCQGIGSYSSSITNYSITGAGQTSKTQLLETDPLQDVGSIPFTVTIRDSRGRTKSATQSITVYDYTPPTVSLTAYRCDDVGNAVTNGTYAAVKATYAIASINGKNTISSKQMAIDGTSYEDTTFVSDSLVILGGDLSIERPYKITVTIKDALNQTAVSTVEIPSDKYVMHMFTKGEGVAFGKVAQRQNTLDSAWPILAPSIGVIVDDEVSSVPIQDIVSACQDTGWQDCSYGYQFDRYAADQAPLQVRRIGHIIHMRGTVRNKSTISAGYADDDNVIGYVPEGFAPLDYFEDFLQQGSGARKFMLRVWPDGKITASRYTWDATVSPEIAAGYWFNCFATWMR